MLEAVYQDIASGRVDVLELLSSRDVRFFAEVVSSTAEVERRLFQLMPDTTLKELVSDLQLSPDHWQFEITPPPSLQAAASGCYETT